MVKILFRSRFALMLFFVFFCFYNFFLVEKTFLKLAALLSIPIFYICIIQFINNWKKNGHPKLLDWFKLATFFSLIIPFFQQITIFNKYNYISVYTDEKVSTEIVLEAMLIVLLGVYFLSLASVLVNLMTFKKRKLNNDYVINGYNKFLFFAFCFLLSKSYLNLSNIVGFGSESLSGTGSLFAQIINIFSNIFFVVISFIKFNKRNYYKNVDLFFYVYLSINLILGFLSGMKENVIVPLIYVLVAYLVNGYKLKLVHLVVPVFIFIFLYPINNNYRSIIGLHQNKMVAFTIALEKTISEFGEKEKENENLLARFEGTQALMYGISVENKWNYYRYLDRYFYLPVSWILPRVILPDKPLADTGVKLYQMVRNTGRTGVSLTATTYGWAYLEGGYIPVIISFFLYGLVISLFQKNISLSNLSDVILYTILLASMVKIESDIYFRISSILQLLFILFIFKKFFLIKKNHVN